ncbi:MAG: hypothetical protein L6R41_005493 [Letrouitia leprolyta]|nr:MAG: hypothetical protein L6R41_005493 [Letrouitia leprolyta]
MTTESSAGTYATRTPSPSEQTLITDILQLYQLNPSEQAYRHYSPEAIFHDPVSIAKGLDSIKSQFNGMPKIFAESTTEKCDLLANDSSSPPNSIALNLTQRYVFKSPIPFKSKGAEKTVNSKVTFTLDGKGRISRHDEEWDHAGNKSGGGEDGWWGKIMEARKKADAKIVESTVSSDPAKA